MFFFRFRENDGHTNNHEETMVTTSSLRALRTNQCCTRMSRWGARMAGTLKDIGPFVSFYTT